jgi:hypothetical protein
MADAETMVRRLPTQARLVDKAARDGGARRGGFLTEQGTESIFVAHYFFRGFHERFHE